MILGGFSRFGIWNHIFAAIVLVVLLWMAETALSEAAEDGPWALVYLPGLGGLALAAAILGFAAGPRRLARRRQGAAA